MKRGDVVAGDTTGGHFIEEGARIGWPAGESFDDDRAVDRVELAIAAGQLLADFRCVEQRESTKGGDIQGTNFQRSLTEFTEVRHALVNEGFKRASACADIRLRVSDEFLRIVDGASVAEDDAEFRGSPGQRLVCSGWQ